MISAAKSLGPPSRDAPFKLASAMSALRVKRLIRKRPFHRIRTVTTAQPGIMHYGRGWCHNATCMAGRQVGAVLGRRP